MVLVAARRSLYCAGLGLHLRKARNSRLLMVLDRLAGMRLPFILFI
jgi:hypothetical protein